MKAQLKHSFSRQHLAAASYFAQTSQAIESSITTPTEEDRSRHRAYITGAILSAAAFLESSINEFFLESVDKNKNTLGSLSDQVITNLAALWSTPKPKFERAEALEKYQSALKIAGINSFKKGGPPYQDTASLFKLRNALLHYKPEWNNELDEHKDLQDRLSKRFPLNPFMPSNSLWFPHQCLGAGCAEWSVTTVQKFISEFTSRMGIPPRS